MLIILFSKVKHQNNIILDETVCATVCRCNKPAGKNICVKKFRTSLYKYISRVKIRLICARKRKRRKIKRKIEKTGLSCIPMYTRIICSNFSIILLCMYFCVTLWWFSVLRTMNVQILYIVAQRKSNKKKYNNIKAYM